MVIDQLRKSYGVSAVLKQRSYVYSESNFLDRPVILAKPMSFMNLSGDAVKELIDKFKIPFANLLIITDDFNIPFGKIRIRAKGSHGGHNGLASILSKLDSTNISRLRIGIGTEGIEDKVKFVLSRFSRKERKKLKNVINHSVEVCFHFVTEGINKTMNKFN